MYTIWTNRANVNNASEIQSLFHRSVPILPNPLYYDRLDLNDHISFTAQRKLHYTIYIHYTDESGLNYYHMPATYNLHKLSLRVKSLFTALTKLYQPLCNTTNLIK